MVVAMPGISPPAGADDLLQRELTLSGPGELIPGASATYEGRLTLAGLGQPLHDIEVLRNGASVATVTTDGAGSFSLELDFPDPGVFSLVARAYAGTPAMIESPVVSVDVRNVIELTLEGPTQLLPEQTASFSGQLTLNGDPAASEEVRVFRFGTLVATATTDGAGMYVVDLTFADPGTFQIKARAYSGTPDMVESAILSVHVGDPTEPPTREAWVARYDAAEGWDGAEAIAVSPDGSRVFVTGNTAPHPDDYPRDWATVAYDTETGAQLWVSSYDNSTLDQANALGVSPDGATVYVTGKSSFEGSGPDYMTLAYNSSTGQEVWSAHYNGVGNANDYAQALDISPDGAIVYITGASTGLGEPAWKEYATVAYDAATGAELWVARDNQGGDNSAYAVDLVASPNGDMVYVTGQTFSGSPFGDYELRYGTIAYNATTGTKVWEMLYDGPGDSDNVAGIGISPDGARLFVTGGSRIESSVGSQTDYATVAYDATTGAELWITRHHLSSGLDAHAHALSVSPDGSAVYVTGQSDNQGFEIDTIGYDTATGDQLWLTRTSEGHAGRAMGVSPNGTQVFVAATKALGGGDVDYLTIAYDTETGAETWSEQYDGPRERHDAPTALAVSPLGSHVFVTGQSAGPHGEGSNGSWYDYATVAYVTGSIEP